MKIMNMLPLVGLLWAATAGAAEIQYDFSGLTGIGGTTRTFTGTVRYDDAALATSAYLNTSTIQGFRTDYLGAVAELSILLDNGETVSSFSGNLQVNNIQQAEAGAPFPAGLSMQVWSAAPTGTINGFSIDGLYLAFLPVTPQFAWDDLDNYFGGNSEQGLQTGTISLPTHIAPALLGTGLPANLPTVFTDGLFLGTNHSYTNTVNTISSFALRVATPVPEPESQGLWLASLAAIGAAARRRRAAAPTAAKPASISA